MIYFCLNKSLYSQKMYVKEIIFLSIRLRAYLPLQKKMKVSLLLE